MRLSHSIWIMTAGLWGVGCAEQKVSFRNTVPEVLIETPVDGAIVSIDSPIEFKGRVSDGQQDSDALVVIWESSQDGLFYDDSPDRSGDISFSKNLDSVGVHAITLTATDAEGESASTKIEIELYGDDSDPDGTTGDDTGEPDPEPDPEPETFVPTVTIDNPVDGATYLQYEPVAILGLVWDDDQSLDTLDVAVLSGIDGELWTGNPDEYGVVAYETSSLSVGTHTLRLIADDLDGNRATAEVQVTITADARPGVVIESPGTGEWYWNTDLIRFEGTVSDDVTDPQDLYIEWSSDIDGVLSRVPANSTGTTFFESALTAGLHTIFLSAVDEDENESSYNISLEVRDPLDHDGDMDGYTENEGDCNDFNPYIHPGAEEICDAYDNNCDGSINEDDADELEVNDSLATATDLGRIDDGWIFGSAETESTGITLHTDSDEDWIRFDSGDDFLVDNVNIDISVGSFPHTGDYVIELYALFESDTIPVDVDMGSGRLSVQYEGDPWDGGEDDFAVRIYADDWPSGTCSRRFEVEIVDM